MKTHTTEMQSKVRPFGVLPPRCKIHKVYQGLKEVPYEEIMDSSLGEILKI